MKFVIEYETVSGDIEEMGAEFDNTDDAMGVCERVHNKYAPTEKFVRFSIVNKETREVYADYEC